MTDVPNMVCPRCNTFQPKADVCNKCGVIIDKASKLASGYASDSGDKSAVKKSSKSSNSKLILLLLIAIPCTAIVLYFVTAGNGEERLTAETNEVNQQSKPAEKFSAIKSAATRNVQRTQVASNLHQLKTKLYFYTSEGGMPPENEEGLQHLVDTGKLTQDDITDVWGNSYVYRLEWGKETPWGKEYKIYIHSKGADGVSGNADDVMMP